MADLLVSDLHLGAGTPQTCARFVAFLQAQMPGIERLWILGDLFEVWVGDDTLDQPEERLWLDPIVAALRRCAESAAVQLLVGNRDFLLGERFARTTAIGLVDEPVRMDLGGVTTVLLHGDTLCTDDTAYQSFRSLVRSPAWQADFLAKPYAQRKAMAQGMRDASRESGAQKAAAILDANPNAAQALLVQMNAQRLIHGHTHRPAQHRYKAGERWVLTDWDETRGGGLRVGARGAIEQLGL